MEAFAVAGERDGLRRAVGGGGATSGNDFDARCTASEQTGPLLGDFSESFGVEVGAASKGS